MKEAIARILTDPSARSADQVEVLLINQAEAFAPWADDSVENQL